MIARLRGKILFKKPTSIVLDVNGVGYHVNIPINTFEKLPDENSEASVFTYLHVKEDALDLYGFITEAEKELFLLLIGVNGIGPKSALSVLSGIQAPELIDAIGNANLGRITAIPGIGKKTAERLIIELRDKVSKIKLSGESSGIYHPVSGDAIAALVSLGYNQKVAEKAVRHIITEFPDITIEELLRKTLAALNN